MSGTDLLGETERAVCLSKDNVMQATEQAFLELPALIWSKAFLNISLSPDLY